MELRGLLPCRKRLPLEPTLRQTIPAHILKPYLRCILILSSQLSLCSQMVFAPPFRILYVFVSYPVHDTCHAHQTALIISGRLQIKILLIKQFFFQPPATSFVLSANVLLNTLFSTTFNSYSYFRMTCQVSYAYKIMDQIMVFYVLIFNI